MSRPPRSVELHIDEIVLHATGPVDGKVLRASIERELARLVAADGVRLDRAVAGDTARLGAPSIEIPAPAGAEALGAGIAGAIFSAITGVRR